MSAGRPDTQFQRTRDTLRAEIGRGGFGDLGLLPGERDLAARLAVSRTTIRRVLAALVQEGCLMHQHGVGTFVTPPTPLARSPPPSPSNGELGGFAAAAHRRGLALTSDILGQDVVQPAPDDAMLLACSPRERVLRLRRLRRIDGQPVAVEDALVKEPFWPVATTLNGSLHAALAAEGTRPVRVLQRVQAAAASIEEAARLEVLPGSPVIRLRRTEYVADGRCCVLIKAALPADGFDLLMELDATSATASGPFTAR